MNRIISTAIILAITTSTAYADENAQLANLQNQINQLQTELNNNSTSNIIGTDPSLSWQMMGNMPGVGKEMTLLQARETNTNTITLGGYAEADAIYQHTNAPGFNAAALSNGATFTGTGTSAASLFMSYAYLSATAAINPWITSYIQMGTKNLGNTSNNMQIQDAYIVAGQLNKSPVYAFIGQKEIDFGSFQSVNMYYAPLTREFFEGIGNTAGLGLNTHGFNGTLSVMNGGSNTNFNTTNNNNINNYALNLSYSTNTSNINWNIGTGYERGSRFLNTSNGTDGAWDLNGKISTASFDLLAEYVATTQKSYGAPILSASIGQTINSWDLGADYNFHMISKNNTVNLDYSQANLANGSNNLLKQLVLGYRIEPINNIWTGIEYAYNINGINASSGTLYNSSYRSSTVLLDLSTAF